jgi:hypothetical protein
MVHKKSMLAVLLILVLLTLFTAGCASTDLGADLGRFFEEMVFALSNFWDDVRLFFMDIGSVFEGMFSGLSGIGEAIGRMFENFSIY